MMSYVYDDVIAKVGQKFYNEDMKFKYKGIGGAENSAADAEKLQKRDFCRGTREEYTRRWLTERLSYLDSRFQVGEEALSTAVVRSNSVSVLKLQIETYHPQWVSVKFMDGTTPVLKRLEANTLTTFSSTECPDLIGGMVTNPVNNNITISCVGNVKRLEGLINLQPSEIMIQAMPRLTSLDVRGTKKLCVLDVLNNKNLQTLNVKDCTKLGWEESVGAFVSGLNLTNCINLRHCDISNTGLTGLQLPKNSGALEYFDASNTNIDAISMIGQPYIEEIKMTNCLKLGSVAANNCARLKKLNLANTTISSLDLSLCLEVEELDISGTSNLNNLSLAGCPNLKILNMSGFNSPNYNILNLASCPKVENLNLSGATNIVKITFAENAVALKTLNLSSSSVESARFGANVEFPDYLDLARFNLSNIKFTNNPRIKHIKNLSYNGNGYQTFLDCTSLHTIECKPDGVFKLTGSLHETFWGCGNLRNIPTNIDLSAASGGNRTFAGCRQLTMAQAKMIMDATKNTGLNSGNMWRFFEGCTGIKGQLPEDFFANAKALAGGNYFFTGCSGITGTLPPRLLQPCAASLRDTGYMFSGLNITGGIPEGFFDGMVNLYEAGHMFSSTKLNGVLPDKMFKDCRELTNVYNMFSGCSSLTGQIPTDLFNYNPKLRSVASFFNGCSSLVGEIPDTIFNLTTGGTYDDLIYVENLFSNCSNLRGSEFPSYLFEFTPNILIVDYLFNGIPNLSAEIPNDFFQFTKRIQSAAYTFANTGAKGLFPARLFRGLTSLTNVAGIFSNCKNITGTLPTCTSEDTKLFADNPLISIIDYMFSGCTALSGSIPENIFFGLEEDTSEIRFDITSAKGVFKNCQTLSGRLPAKLLYKFKTCEDLSEFFENCYKLQGAIPNGFFSQCTALKKCNGMFSEANGIGIREVNSIDKYCIPEDLFEKNYFLQSCSGMFQSWGNATPLPTGISHGLKGEIPPGLFDNCPNLLDVSGMFAGQNEISGLLDGDLFRFNTNIENLSTFIGGCGGITQLGDGFLSNNKKVNNVHMMFYGCGYMVGTMAPIWENNYCPDIPASDNTKYQQCFTGCVKLTNYYTEIPKQWGGGKEIEA